MTADRWQGTLASDGTQRWAVGGDLHGLTDFRWQLLDAEGGSVIGTSETFDLPTSRGEVVMVGISAE